MPKTRLNQDAAIAAKSKTMTQVESQKVSRPYRKELRKFFPGTGGFND
jgi:hypothetical protein